MALKKLNRLKTFFGYPEKMIDDNFIDNYYSDLVIDSDNSLLTNLSILGNNKNELIPKFTQLDAKYVDNLISKYFSFKIYFLD